MTPCLIPVDKKGDVIGTCHIWADKRAFNEVEWINRKLGEDTIPQLSGNNVKTGYLAPKIVWFKSNEPELYKNTYKFLQPNGFINMKLTGDFSMDRSNCELTLLADKFTGKWDEKICGALGISLEKLPEVKECADVIGYVTKLASDETGLPEGIPVIAGGNDSAVASYAMNVVEPGNASLDIGNAANLGMCITKPVYCNVGDLYSHVLPGKWMLQVFSATAGAALRWFKEELAELETVIADKLGSSAYEMLDAQASKAMPGSSGVIFVPYLQGAQDAPDAKGCILGISTSTKRSDIIRAVLEGCAFAVRRNMEFIEGTVGQKMDRIYLGGGGSGSDLWSQIHADVMGKTMVVPQIRDAAVLGSALLAGLGAGIIPHDIDIEKIVPVERVYEPDHQNKEIYDIMFEKFCRVFRAGSM